MVVLCCVPAILVSGKLGGMLETKLKASFPEGGEGVRHVMS